MRNRNFNAHVAFEVKFSQHIRDKFFVVPFLVIVKKLLLGQNKGFETLFIGFPNSRFMMNRPIWEPSKMPKINFYMVKPKKPGTSKSSSHHRWPDILWANWSAPVRKVLCHCLPKVKRLLMKFLAMKDTNCSCNSEQFLYYLKWTESLATWCTQIALLPKSSPSLFKHK